MAIVVYVMQKNLDETGAYLAEKAAGTARPHADQGAGPPARSAYPGPDCRRLAQLYAYTTYMQKFLVNTAGFSRTRHRDHAGRLLPLHGHPAADGRVSERWAARPPWPGPTLGPAHLSVMSAISHTHAPSPPRPDHAAGRFATWLRGGERRGEGRAFPACAPCSPCPTPWPTSCSAARRIRRRLAEVCAGRKLFLRLRRGDGAGRRSRPRCAIPTSQPDRDDDLSFNRALPFGVCWLFYQPLLTPELPRRPGVNTDPRRARAGCANGAPRATSWTATCWATP